MRKVWVVTVQWDTNSRERETLVFATKADVEKWAIEAANADEKFKKSELEYYGEGETPSPADIASSYWESGDRDYSAEQYLVASFEPAMALVASMIG